MSYLIRKTLLFLGSKYKGFSNIPPYRNFSYFSVKNLWMTEIGCKMDFHVNVACINFNVTFVKNENINALMRSM